MARIVFATLALATLCGCMTARQRLLQEDFRSEVVVIPHKLGSVSVVDRRKNIAAQDLSIPLIEIKFRNETVRPPLTLEQSELLKAELPQYFSGKNKQLDVLIEVLSSQKKYSTDWAGQHERAKAKIRVTLIEPSTKEYIDSAAGEIELSLDAQGGQTTINQLYAKALKSALYQATKAIANPE